MRDLSESTIHLYDSKGNEIVVDGQLPVNVDDILEQLDGNPDFNGPYATTGGELLQEVVIPIEIEFLNVGVEVRIAEWAIKGTTPGYN
jgi:hypothetical protein